MRVWLDPERIAAARDDRRAGDRRACARRTCRWRAARWASRRSTTEQRLPDLAADEGAPAEAGRVREHHRQDPAPTAASCASRTSAASSWARSATRPTATPDSYPAVIVVVDQQPGSNAVRRPTGHQGRDGGDGQEPFPKGLEYRIIYNPTEFIEVSIKEALQHHSRSDRAGRRWSCCCSSRRGARRSSRWSPSRSR